MTSDWLRFKWGVSKLVLESKLPPIIVPIWHEGFEHILPNTPPYVPQIGKRVTVLVGDPIDTEPLLKELRLGGKLGGKVDHGGDGGEGSKQDTNSSSNNVETLFKPEEKKKIMEMYGLTELSTVEMNMKKLCDYLENEMKKLKERTQAVHFVSQ